MQQDTTATEGTKIGVHVFPITSVPTHSNDPLLSGEDRLKLNELIELCTNLSQRVLNLRKRNFKTKTSQATEITKLKERVKKLGKERRVKNSQAQKIIQEKEVDMAEKMLYYRSPLLLPGNSIIIANVVVSTTEVTTDNYELAIRLQAEEQGELTVEEKSRLFVELMNKRMKHFSRLRAEEQRRKPPTKAQKRNTMSTYLKNMDGYKHN
ncbi:hypothetical protein Tco_0005923 [Tanacetum coccineum]